MKIRIATRKSHLALWQAEYVKRRLIQLYPNIQVSLIKMTSKGDRILDSPLAKIGGKGLFVKELESALLEKKADIAVHSMKDVPMCFPKGLMLNVICPRENPLDAFVSNKYNSLESLPVGAIVGTSSLRRQSQLLNLRPDLTIKFLRGNVNTRLSKLDHEEYDAIILASAGLIRLNFESRIGFNFPSEQMLPAAGQGAIGIESRIEDEWVNQLLAPLHDIDTADRVVVERTVNLKLNGGCQVPIACYALIDNDKMFIRALVGEVDGSNILRAQKSCYRDEGVKTATELAECLLNQGADSILKKLIID